MYTEIYFAQRLLKVVQLAVIIAVVVKHNI